MSKKDSFFAFILGVFFLVWGIYFLSDLDKLPANGLAVVLGIFCMYLSTGWFMQNQWLEFVRGISTLQDLAKQLPTGLTDQLAVKKLLREMEEIDEEETFIDKAMEAGDVTYYVAKAIANGLLSKVGGYMTVWAAVRKVGKPLNMALAIKIAIAKFKFRAQPGNPKDPEAERELALQVMGMKDGKAEKLFHSTRKIRLIPVVDDGNFWMGIRVEERADGYLLEIDTNDGYVKSIMPQYSSVKVEQENLEQAISVFREVCLTLNKWGELNASDETKEIIESIRKK